MTNPRWTQAMTALRLLSIDPSGLGGVWLRARIGPPRDSFIAHAKTCQPNWARFTPATTDEALFGGLDITQTLALGKPTFSRGLLDQNAAMFALSSAERTSAHLAARLAGFLDHTPKNSLIALDEGIDDEAPPASLTDRLAFHISLNDLRPDDCPEIRFSAPTGDPSNVAINDDALRDLTLLATKLGISDLRAPLFAIRAARASAALEGRNAVNQTDLETAATLVLAPRALFIEPDLPLPEQAPKPEEPPEESPETATKPDSAPPLDQLIDATLAALPPDILAGLMANTSAPIAAGISGQGAVKKGDVRGRPLPPRKGKPDGRRRVDLIATLRAAAPWQAVRAKGSPKTGMHIRASDIHLKHYQTRSDRLLIFTVDASGSAAMNRLAEAKGAVELLLAEAYASRDHVALISYNKQSADLLLPPTRSLVRTKRRLAGLPGGGGTPLASGLKAAFDLAQTSRRKGFQPALILIADGRTNIDLQGNADRANAINDALTVAKSNAIARTPGVLIDMSKRPEPQLQEVSQTMNISYAALPFVDARGLSNLVATKLETA